MNKYQKELVARAEKVVRGCLTGEQLMMAEKYCKRIAFAMYPERSITSICAYERQVKRFDKLLAIRWEMLEGSDPSINHSVGQAKLGSLNFAL